MTIGCACPLALSSLTCVQVTPDIVGHSWALKNSEESKEENEDLGQLVSYRDNIITSPNVNEDLKADLALSN